MRHCVGLVVLLALLLSGCASTPTASEDPFEVTEGTYRARLAVTPMPPRVGERVTFTVAVTDAATGEPIEGLIMRPTVTMTMAQSVHRQAERHPQNSENRGSDGKS